MFFEDALIRIGNNMKLLIITGLYPEESNPSSGIFITREMKKLQEYGVQYDLISFFIKEKWDLRLLKKVLKRPLNKEMNTLKINGVQYDFLPIEFSLLDKVLYHNRISKLVIDQITKKLNLCDYDLIHAHWVYPHGYIASLIKKQTGIPCIISAHGSDIHTNPYKIPKSIPSIIFSLESADKVFFTSNKLFETAKKLGYRGNNHIILPMGVETNKFIPMEKEKVRKKLGLSPLDSKYIGFVGSLKWIKRADRFPEIFKQVSKQYNNVQFLVIGDGGLRPDIEKRCMLYNLKVKFTGRINPDEIPLWMNALDVLVLPSRNEGFPCVILEAQSCGCPIVGSNAGGIPEAIGNGGLVVDIGPGFEENFGNAVISMLKNPPQREQLRKRALKFDWNRIIKKQIEVYEDIIKK